MGRWQNAWCWLAALFQALAELLRDKDTGLFDKHAQYKGPDP
jgi:hypothetical protein